MKTLLGKMQLWLLPLAALLSLTSAAAQQGIIGTDYGPFRDGQNPNMGIFPTMAQMQADMPLLKAMAGWIRIYSVTNGMEQIPTLAKPLGLKVAAGAFLSTNATANSAEIQNLISVANQNDNVAFVSVGSETLLRGDLTKQQLIADITQVKQSVSVPVTTAEPWSVWRDNPDLVNSVDFIFMNVHPYWENQSINNAVAYVLQRYNEIQTQYPGKHIVISETGWPSTGAVQGSAVPSLANERLFIQQWIAAAWQNNIDYFLFESFDEQWKSTVEGEVGAHWGFYDSSRAPKFDFGALNPRQAVDLAAASDGQARLLWTYTDGRMLLETAGNTGASSYGPTYGPYPGYTAARIAAGADGLVRVLWNKNDGTAALWLVGLNNLYQASYSYGPYPGWTASDITIGSDNKAHILWTHSNGQMAVWSVDNSGSPSYGPVYGPFPGFTARAIASGPDGQFRVLWNRNDGVAGLWLMASDNTYRASYGYGPYPGWTAVDIAVGADNQARLLWTHSSGQMAIWSIDNSGTPSYGPIYGPYSGFTASAISSGADTLTRVLWTQPNGTAALWVLGLNNMYQVSYGSTPY